MRRRQGLPTAAFALVKHPTDPSGPHESCDACVPAGHSPLLGEVGVNPWGTIGSPRTLMRPLNQFKQPRIPDRPGGGFPSHPVIKPGTRDPHNPARHRHRKPLGSQLMDAPEGYYGRIFSLAKYADARFRISFSISNTRVFRRSSMSSLFSALVSPSTRPESTASIAVQRRSVPSLIPQPFATWATGSPIATRSKALRRNSGGFAAGITDILPWKHYY